MEDLNGIAGPASFHASICTHLRRVDHVHDAVCFPQGIQRVVDAGASLHRLLCLRRDHLKAIEMAIQETP